MLAYKKSHLHVLLFGQEKVLNPGEQRTLFNLIWERSQECEKGPAVGMCFLDLVPNQVCVVMLPG